MPAGETRREAARYLARLAADGASTDVVRAIIKGPPAGHTVRGIAKSSGRTVAATARAVRRLEDRGIISVVPDGRSRAVRPNMGGYALKKVPAPPSGPKSPRTMQ